MAYLNILREVLPPNAIVTDELSQVGFASWYGFPVYQPRTFITSGYQGTLGSGFPTALGAKVAHPDRPVVAITGDGGFMFGVQELATAVQFKIGVVTLIFNNNAYGNVRRDQRERFDGRVVASDLVNPDFVKLAESFGVGAARVTSPEGFRPALEKALADGGPYVIAIEVPTDLGKQSVEVHPSREAIKASGKEASSFLAGTGRRSARFPESQVDALPAQQRMLAVRQRCDAVKGQPRRAAPHRDIAVLQPEAPRLVAALHPPNRKIAGKPSDTETIGAPKSFSSLS